MTDFELIAQGYGLVDAPRVDRQNRLLFSDHLYGGVYRREVDGSIRTLLPNRKGVGGLAFGRGDSLIISGESVATWSESTGDLRDLFSGHPGRTGRFFNDLTVDEHGSLYIGTVNADAANAGKEKPPPGDLYRVDPEGTSALLWEGIPASNGLGFSPGGKLLYHANSIPGQIWVYDVKDVSCATAACSRLSTKDGPTGWQSTQRAESGSPQCSPVTSCGFAPTALWTARCRSR